MLHFSIAIPSTLLLNLLMRTLQYQITLLKKILTKPHTKVLDIRRLHGREFEFLPRFT